MRNKSYGQYMDVSRSEIVGHNGTKYRVIIYGAYNAMGLIGTEMNGIAVLDEDTPCVIVDGIATTSSGMDTPTRTQLAYFKNMCLADYEQFRDMIVELGGDRYRGWLPAVEKAPA